ncbi:uncharacterized protein EV420DRAFT_1104434 [Desarmillaria tabescens]|uniref:Uncharacterized protein n=1 Tax=Armillaria tabescens TaxID=1929756 RepID=A0AA39NDW1_ARMTA|nr:uncharacterized protein EV420DRAFT_1104434 [Desarmillaria tabescens]KAK0463714.1 hypothetical protein EV420DRAFT_1104434 [Desarmillaria tabescens]
MVAPLFDSDNQLAPPWHSYFTFSVVATLELFCDGEDDNMLWKLDSLQDRKHAGYCMQVEDSSEEDTKYYVLQVRPAQQGLTKAHSRKSQLARPTMCVPILPETAHPKSREPLAVSKPLSWENCYHPTCYNLCMRALAERRDHSQSTYVKGTLEFDKAVMEDYCQLLQDGLSDDRILRILSGQEGAPDTDIPDDASQTSTKSDARSEASQIFLAKVPGTDKLEEDRIFDPVMHINHVLLNLSQRFLIRHNYAETWVSFKKLYKSISLRATDQPLLGRRIRLFPTTLQ